MIDLTKYPEAAQLSPEEQATAERYFARVAQPELSDDTIGNVVGSRRTQGDLGRANSRLEAALMKKQGGLASLGQSFQPNAVPSAWGPILTRKSPAEKLIAALGAGVGAYRANKAEGDITGLMDKAQGQETDYQKGLRGQNETANRDAMRRIVEAMLSMRRGQTPGGY